MLDGNWVESDTLVVLAIEVNTVIAFVHLIELVKDVLLVVVYDDGGDGGPSLSRLLLKLLLAIGVRDHIYLAILVHDYLSPVNEVLNLDSDALCVA